MGPKYVVIKKGNMVLYFHDKEVLCAGIAIRRSFDPTEILLQEDLQDLLHKAKTFHLKT
jgi:hypothetical protein